MIAISLNANATFGLGVFFKVRSEDQLRAFYHAYLFRELVMERQLGVDAPERDCLVSVSYERMKRSFSRFREKLEKAGWDCQHLFLEERDCRFSKE